MIVNESSMFTTTDLVVTLPALSVTVILIVLAPIAAFWKFALLKVKLPLEIVGVNPLPFNVQLVLGSSIPAGESEAV